MRLLSLLTFAMLCGAPFLHGDVPFEPGFSSCYSWKDKFDHPSEIVPPRYIYPAAMLKAGIEGEVVALVVLKADGSPARIATLYDTHYESPVSSGPHFSESVIQGLTEARWSKQQKEGVWFYKKVRFQLITDDEAKPPSRDGVVIGIVPCGDSVMKGKQPNLEGCVRPERSGAVNTTIVEQAPASPEAPQGRPD